MMALTPEDLDALTEKHAHDLETARRLNRTMPPEVGELVNQMHDPDSGVPVEARRAFWYWLATVPPCRVNERAPVVNMAVVASLELQMLDIDLDSLE